MEYLEDNMLRQFIKDSSKMHELPKSKLYIESFVSIIIEKGFKL